jgi:hypothetical protein
MLLTEGFLGWDGWQEGWVGGRLGGWCVRYGWIGRQREKVKGGV